MEIRKVAVVGMGTMGTQIGIVSARGGFETVIVDLSDELIKKGISSMRSFLMGQVEGAYDYRPHGEAGQGEGE